MIDFIDDHRKEYGVAPICRVLPIAPSTYHEHARGAATERLMRKMGLHGVMRGRPVRTTISDKAVPCPLDTVNRRFHAPAPNRLWLSDFTYVATWTGFVYVAFVIDVQDRGMEGESNRTCRVRLGCLRAGLARTQARKWRGTDPPFRSRQSVRLEYTERLATAGIEPSVGVSEIPTTTLWLRPSTDSTKPK